MITNSCNFFLILFGIIVVNFTHETVSDGINYDIASVYGQISIFHDDILSLCTHIAQLTLPTANTLKTLLRNAHIYCPDYKEMGPVLSQMGINANKYFLLVEEQLRGCRELSEMLTSGPDSNGLVISYLHQGNHSLAIGIINKWDQSLVHFSDAIHLIDTTLAVMLDNNKIFHHDIRIETFGLFLINLMILIFRTTIVSLICVWISSINDLAATFDQFIERLLKNQSSTSNYSLPTEIAQDDGVHPHLIYRRTTQQTVENYNVFRRNSFENGTLVSIMKNITLRPATFYTIFGIVIWIFVFCALLAATLLWDPAAFSYSKVIQHNWYPDATSTLERMKNDTDDLHSKVTRQIDSIEELRDRANVYYDKAVETVVDELMHFLVDVFRQVNQEMSNAYSLSEKMLSSFRRAYKNIEEKAKKAGKLNETYGLLVDMNITVNRFEALRSSLTVAISRQPKIVSSLIEQVEPIGILVKQNRSIELTRIVENYRDALMYIDENTYNVEIAINQVIELVDSKHLYGLKSIIASLIETSIYDQVKAFSLGATKSVTGTIVGMLTIRIGCIMATMTPSIVRGPALAISSGSGMIVYGAYGSFSHFDDYMEASRFKSELAVLEIVRDNVEVAMEQLKKAIGDQQKSSKSSQSALRTLAKYCGLFS